MIIISYIGAYFRPTEVVNKKPIIQPGQRNRKRHTCIADDIEVEILKFLKEEGGQVKKEVIEDEDIVFGKSIGLSLKKLQPQQKSLAKIKIQQI